MNARTRRSKLVFHIDNRLGRERRNEIELALAEKQGVSAARFNERRIHLLLVEYDPDVTSSFDLMDRVRRQNVNVQRVA
ncbi:MAG: hypothetical protein WBN51_08140 [Gammaproteobacteria bacterium]